MKYLAMLKKEENIHPDELPKLPEPPFDGFDSDPKRHISKKQAAPASTPDLGNRPGDDWFDERICDVIDDLNAAGCQYTDASQEDRDRARALELEYTVAANNGDSPRFWKALREWKAIWIRELH